MGWQEHVRLFVCDEGPALMPGVLKKSETPEHEGIEITLPGPMMVRLAPLLVVFHHLLQVSCPQRASAATALGRPAQPLRTRPADPRVLQTAPALRTPVHLAVALLCTVHLPVAEHAAWPAACHPSAGALTQDDPIARE